LEQNANVEKEKTHNLKGMPPSTFGDIVDKDLRSYNRGAVLANIYERHTSEDSRGNIQLTSRDLASCTREIDNYLYGMSRRERQTAREQMMVHLRIRGFYEKT